MSTDAESDEMTVLVVDDHAVVRSGCRRLLGPPMGRFRVVEAADGAAALDLAAREAPAVLVVDLNMAGEPNGIGLVQALAETGAAVVVLSMHEAPQVAARCLEAGALAYVSKSDEPEAVVEAVAAALEGRVWLARDMALAVAALGRMPAREPRPLTPREADIMGLLAETSDIARIAERLGISYKTVANTLVRLRNRYGVRRTADLVRIVVRDSGS